MWSGHAVRGYPIGFFNPVTPTQCKPRNPNGYFQHPASSAYFQSRFCLQTPNPGLQIRKPIPQPVTPIPITPTGELIVLIDTGILYYWISDWLCSMLLQTFVLSLVAMAFVLCQIKVHVYFETRMRMIDIFTIISLHNVWKYCSSY